jgi:hypothetical protein
MSASPPLSANPSSMMSNTPESAQRRNCFHTQGNRVNDLPCDEACQEVVVPGGDLAAQAH